MTKSLPYYGLAATRAVVDPNPRDPGSGTNHAPVFVLALRQGPQPRDDGSRRQYGSGQEPKRPKGPQPRDPGRGKKRRESFSFQPRDAGF